MAFTVWNRHSAYYQCFRNESVKFENSCRFLISSFDFIRSLHQVVSTAAFLVLTTEQQRKRQKIANKRVSDFQAHCSISSRVIRRLSDTEIHNCCHLFIADYKNSTVDSRRLGARCKRTDWRRLQEKQGNGNEAANKMMKQNQKAADRRFGLLVYLVGAVYAYRTQAAWVIILTGVRQAL